MGKKDVLSHNSLSLTCLNINGLFNRQLNYCKLNDPELVHRLTKFDIIGLTETHCFQDETPFIEGYKTFTMHRPLKGNARKPSGGIAAFVRSIFSDGVTLNDRSNQHVIW